MIGLAAATALREVWHGRKLRALLASFLLFGVAEWGTWVAMLVWAASAGGPQFIGIAAAIQLVFASLSAPVLAGLGDRMPRSRALAIGYSGMALSMLGTGLVLVADPHPLIGLAATSIVAASVTIARPIHASLVPDLASSPADAVAANVASSTLEGAGIFIGPAVAGVVMGFGGPGWAFVAMAAAPALGAMLVFRMGRADGRADGDPGGGGGPLAGFVSVIRTGEQRMVIAVGGLGFVVVGALDVLAVVLALDELDAGQDGAGYFVALIGLGGLIGGMAAVTLVGRRRLAPALVVGSVLRGGALILLGLQTSWVLLLVAAGAGQSLIDVTVRTLLQRLAPAALMARIFGVLESLAMLGLAAGSILAPFAAEQLGLAGAFVVFGVGLPTVVLIGLRRLIAADHASDVAGDILEALRTMRLLSAMQPQAIEALARRGRLVNLRSGETAIAEGDRADDVFFVVDGRLIVSKGGRRLAACGPHDVVGEIAAMHGVPRTASVTADGAVAAVRVPGPAFVSTVRGDTAAWSLSKSLAAGRLAEQQSSTR